MNSEVLDDLCDVIGYTATRAVVAWYGGRQLYVPKTASPGHELHRVLGMAAFVALVEEFAGIELNIPHGHEDVVYERDVRMAERISSGATKSQLVAEFSLTERRVEQLQRVLAERGWLEVAGALRRGRPARAAVPRILGTGGVSSEPPPPAAAVVPPAAAARGVTRGASRRMQRGGGVGGR